MFKYVCFVYLKSKSEYLSETFIQVSLNLPQFVWNVSNFLEFFLFEIQIISWDLDILQLDSAGLTGPDVKANFWLSTGALWKKRV